MGTGPAVETQGTGEEQDPPGNETESGRDVGGTGRSRVESQGRG